MGKSHWIFKVPKEYRFKENSNGLTEFFTGCVFMSMITVCKAGELEVEIKVFFCKGENFYVIAKAITYWLDTENCMCSGCSKTVF